MTTQEQPINIKAAAWTAGVHVLLLLFFFLFRYSLPAAAPYEELGLEVNLGTSDEGSGVDQPMSTDDPASGETSVAFTNTSQDESDPARELETSNDPNAPTIAPLNTGSNNSRLQTQRQQSRSRNNQQQTNANSTQRQQPRYVYQGGNGAGGNSGATNQPGGSEGNTTGNGDRGVPGGTPGSSNYTGSPGNGTGGINHTLSGRSISPNQFMAEFSQGGKVIIRVRVDRDGNILSKSVTSATSPALRAIALQKLSQAKFSKKADAAPEQIGDITFVFKTRKQ